MESGEGERSEGSLGKGRGVRGVCGRGVRGVWGKRSEWSLGESVE